MNLRKVRRALDEEWQSGKQARKYSNRLKRRVTQQNFFNSASVNKGLKDFMSHFSFNRQTDKKGG